MHYDLTRLGSSEFEHLSQSLFLKLLGTQVGIFGEGPDGGREATYDGQSTWTTGVKRDAWDGYHVLQAKFRTKPHSSSTDQTWFLREVKRELDNWANRESKRRKEGRVPEYLILATNVALSAVEGGGIDRVEELLAQYATDLGLKGWRVWHHAQICAYLDDAADIRQAYAGLLTAGDVLAQLRQVLQGTVVDLGDALTAHAAKDLLAERWIRLGQAGANLSDKLTLDQVAVDLPARRLEQNESVVSTVEHIVTHGDRVLRRSIASKGFAPHIVLIGGPGQGKTTLGQLITQTYRVALLGANPDKHGREVATTLTDTRQTLEAQAIPQPKNLRWPIRVDLAAYGDEVGGGQQTSLLRWLAQQITTRASMDITAGQLRSWLKNWPWLLVLDGLDEVASPYARANLMQRISDFFVDVEQVDADVLVVITTRPQGYSEEFSSPSYEHMTLEPLNTDLAMAYARQLADVRHRGDEDMHRLTLERLRQAFREPLTKRLMSTPLQVTIMSLLFERRARPPQDRHGVFEAYYDTIYAREAGKSGPLAQLLDAHRQDVHALHEQVGLRMQALAETEGDANAAMPASELRQLAIGRLVTEGHDESTAIQLAHEIVRAATDRLVLLVPKQIDDVGFEVRSLQEYMAARAIVGGPDELVLHRLRLIAPAVHWRNTWLLAGGRLFSTRDHLRGRLVGLLRECDSENSLSTVMPTGPDLALELLDDDLAAKAPHYRRQLLTHALEVLRHPPARGVEDRAGILLGLSDVPDLRGLIVREVERAMAGAADQRATAWFMLQAWRAETGDLAAKARQLAHSATFTSDQSLVLNAWTAWKGEHPRKKPEHPRERPELPAGTQRHPLGWQLRKPLASAGLNDSEERLVQDLLNELDQTEIVSLPNDHLTCMPPTRRVVAPSANAAVTNPEVSYALALALLEIPAKSWAVSSTIQALLREAIRRQSVGPKLIELFRDGGNET